MQVAIIIYILINIYTTIHVVHYIPQPYKSIAIGVITLIACLSVYLAFQNYNGKTTKLIWITLIYGAIVVNLMIYYIMSDIIYFFNKIGHIYDPSYHRYVVFAFTAFGLCSLIYGYFAAMNVKTVDVYIKSSTPLPNGKKEILIAGATDIHINSLGSAFQVDHLIEYIEKTKPDFVMLSGDIFDDHSIEEAKKIEQLKNFTKLTVPVYAVLGNHEFYASDYNEYEKIMESLNWTLVNDKYVIDEKTGLYVVGRYDKMILHATGKARLTLDEILKDKPKDDERPIILLDHEPRDLEQPLEHGALLSFYGHTHNGQFFPFNFIVQGIYENAYGLIKKDNSYFYTSNGFGFWGPPIRTNGQGEFVLFHITSD